jgi:hypothetical protein
MLVKRNTLARSHRGWLTAALAVGVLASSIATASAGSTRNAPNGLVYSTVSGHVVQAQPPAGSCHARHEGLYSLPDPRCTPGALNPAVTQATIDATICRRGWTSTIRPPQAITGPEKRASMKAYGHRQAASGYEYDHYVSLELGGAVNDPRNLWPEPDYPERAGFYLNPKDELEGTLKRLVCQRKLRLGGAQRLIASDWPSAYRRFVKAH